MSPRTKTIRIKLTPEEKQEYRAIAFTFTLGKDKRLIIEEEWDVWDDIYALGIEISVPARVWAEALAWLAREGTE